MGDWLMGDWASYELQDFLLFAEPTYWRLFERLNAAFWPFQIPVVLVLLGGLLVGFTSPRMRRGLFGLLGLCWIGAAVGFAPLYAEINWAMAYLAPLFWVQAIGMLGFALLARASSGAEGTTFLRLIAGMSVAVAAMLIWPLAALFLRGSFSSAEVIGVAPDPAAIATLGLATALARGWFAAALCVVPLIWCVVSAVSLITMGALAEGWLVGAAVIAILAARLFGAPATAGRA